MTGKQRRRLEIRARHTIAVERFTRWQESRGHFLFLLSAKPHKHAPRTWHHWHALGGP